jgi:chemotaxis protein MotA
MVVIIGIACLFVMVFGGYIIAGGKMEPVLEAIPHEMMTIGGAGVASFLISNSMATLKGMGGAFGGLFKGSKWKKKDYVDVLVLLYLLVKTMKTKGIIALESHIEKPEESPIFSQFPTVLHDHFAVDLICDTLRMMTMNMDDPHQIENHIDKQIEKHHHEALGPSHAMQSLADALPALGIVAAVLGVIKTMGSIDQPPPVLGAMIGGALVGTFLGVFLAYGLAGPMSAQMAVIANQDATPYHIIRDVLVSYLHGNAVQVAVEMGRGSIASDCQPTFAEIEEATNNAKADGGAAA